MSLNAPAWLTARPIAHRGLHDAAGGVAENTVAAALAAADRGCALECDVQLTGDGEAIVFHDFTLDRLTEGKGNVRDTSAAAMAALPMRAGVERVPTLRTFLAAVGARTPVVIELKSMFDGDMRLAQRVAEVVRGIDTPVAIKSFDPDVMAWLRAHAHESGIGHVPLGIVAEAHYLHAFWDLLTPDRRRQLMHFLHWQDTRPDFLSWHVDDLPHAVPYLLRACTGVPVMAWTVRTLAQRDNALRWADQIVFENADQLLPPG